MDQVLAPFLGKENVINAPIRVYPSSPPWTSKEGRGVYEIHVDKGWRGYRGQNFEVFRRSDVRQSDRGHASQMALAQWPKDNRIAARVCPHTRQLPRLDSVGEHRAQARANIHYFRRLPCCHFVTILRICAVFRDITLALLTRIAATLSVWLCVPVKS